MKSDDVDSRVQLPPRVHMGLWDSKKYLYSPSDTMLNTIITIDQMLHILNTSITIGQILYSPV